MGKGILRLLSVAAAFAACLAVPAASQAGFQTFGSDLSSPANVQAAHGADTAYWSSALGNGTSPTVPALGQVTQIRLKGYAGKNIKDGPDPLNEVHFQVLRPQPDGRVKVEMTSQPFRVPIEAGPDRVTAYDPINFCVRPGDYLAFNVEGGWVPNYYDNGVPFYTFGRVSNASTQWYEKDMGTNNGEIFGSQTMRGVELLMQMTLATGKDATPICERGPITNDDFPGVTIHDQVALVNPEKGHTRIRTTCPAGIRVHCTGPMTLTSVATPPSRRKKALDKSCKKASKRAKRAKRARSSSKTLRRLKKASKKICKKAKKVPGKVPGGIRIGRNDRFWLDPTLTRDVRVPMTPEGLRLVKKHRAVKLVAVADVTDGAGQPQTTRANVVLKAPKRWR